MMWKKTKGNRETHRISIYIVFLVLEEGSLPILGEIGMKEVNVTGEVVDGILQHLGYLRTGGRHFGHLHVLRREADGLL